MLKNKKKILTMRLIIITYVVETRAEKTKTKQTKYNVDKDIKFNKKQTLRSRQAI